MYEFILADPQVFSNSQENLLYFQGWKTDVPGPVKVIHVVGEVDPPSVDMNITIEDVFVTMPAGKYSNFYVTNRVFDFIGRTEDRETIFTFAGAMANLNLPGLELTPQNLNQFLQHIFQDFSLLMPQSYSWTLRIAVHGRRADSGSLELNITELNIPFELEILAESEILAVPAPLQLAHIKGEAPLQGQELEVITGMNFQISIPSYFNLSGGNIVPTTVTPTHQRYTGSGRQTLTITVDESFDLYQGNLYTSYVELKTLTDRTSYRREFFSTQVIAHLFDAPGFVVNPEALEFISIKGIESATAKELDVVATQAYVVQHPFWLQVSPLAGDYFQKLTVIPISSNNLVPGDYHGVILLLADNVQMEVPVYLKVVESISEAFSKTGLNFTHDNREWSYLYSDNPAERAAVSLGISAYNFQGFPQITEHPFLMTFFNSRARIHIGEIVARCFNKLSSPALIGYRHINVDEEDPQLFKIFPYYRPASVNISFSIEARSTGEVSESKEFSSIQFVSGRKPNQFQDDLGILSYEAVPVRVTRSSQLLFNFVRRFLNHEIKIYKNQEIYKTVTHTPGNHSLFGMAMFFNDFLPGDVISVRLYQNEDSYFEQKYIVIPDQQYSNHISFINEYNVLQCFEFTGAHEVVSDYKSLKAKPYQNLVEHIENLETKKEASLILNTGHIFKSNLVIVDAILRARKVWLLQDGKEISLTPKDKSVSTEDSERELYSYDVEFQINRDNELEVYYT